MEEPTLWASTMRPKQLVWNKTKSKKQEVEKEIERRQKKKTPKNKADMKLHYLQDGGKQLE